MYLASEADAPGGIHAAVLLRVHPADSGRPVGRLLAVFPGLTPGGPPAQPHSSRPFPPPHVSTTPPNSLFEGIVRQTGLPFLKLGAHYTTLYKSTVELFLQPTYNLGLTGTQYTNQLLSSFNHFLQRERIHIQCHNSSTSQSFN